MIGINPRNKIDQLLPLIRNISYQNKLKMYWPSMLFGGDTFHLYY